MIEKRTDIKSTMISVLCVHHFSISQGGQILKRAVKETMPHISMHGTDFTYDIKAVLKSKPGTVTKLRLPAAVFISGVSFPEGVMGCCPVTDVWLFLITRMIIAESTAKC